MFTTLQERGLNISYQFEEQTPKEADLSYEIGT